MDKVLTKAESNKYTTPASTTEMGSPKIKPVSRFFQDTCVEDLKMPKRLCTFDTMCQDDAVDNALTITTSPVVEAMYKGSFRAKTAKGKVAADFLNYCIRNMGHGTWLDFCLEATTDIKYGFSLFNIVMMEAKSGKYKGSKVIRKLSPRSQDSLYAWLYDDTQKEIIGIAQKPMAAYGQYNTNINFIGTTTLPRKNARELSINNYKYPIILNQNLLHFKYNSTNSNPQGDSPLMHCYQAWKEKKVVEAYEINGVATDIGGLVVLRVHPELMERAQDSIANPKDYEAFVNMQRQAAAVHAGDQVFITLSSELVEGSNSIYQYDITRLGIEGGGRQFSTTDIITSKQKAIYNVFGAGYLLLGQDNVGSHALASTSKTTSEIYIDRAKFFHKDVLDNYLAPRILAANDIYLDWEDMPEFVMAEENTLDLDTWSKVIQRVKSVSGLTIAQHIRLNELAGLPIDDLSSVSYEDPGTSRSGDGMATAGPGTSKKPGGGDRSVSNNSNGGVTKSFALEDETDTHMFFRDTESDELIIQNKE